MSLKNVINCMLQFLDVPMEYLRHAILGMDTFLSIFLLQIYRFKLLKPILF